MLHRVYFCNALHCSYPPIHPSLHPSIHPSRLIHLSVHPHTQLPFHPSALLFIPPSLLMASPLVSSTGAETCMPCCGGLPVWGAGYQAHRQCPPCVMVTCLCPDTAQSLLLPSLSWVRSGIGSLARGTQERKWLWK